MGMWDSVLQYLPVTHEAQVQNQALYGHHDDPEALAGSSSQHCGCGAKTRTKQIGIIREYYLSYRSTLSMVLSLDIDL